MSQVREVWFSTRRLVVCHIYSDCGATDNIQPHNEASTWVEINEAGYPIGLPATADLCERCEKMFFAIFKSDDPQADDNTFRDLV